MAATSFGLELLFSSVALPPDMRNPDVVGMVFRQSSE